MARFATSTALTLTLTLACAGVASNLRAQEGPRPPRPAQGPRGPEPRDPRDPRDPREQPWPEQQVQQQIENIARDRPPQAEAAARAFIFNIANDRVGSGEGPIGVPLLDQLKAADPNAYWREIGQLTVQFDMFQRVVSQDTARARLMGTLFATEFEARALQRTWRNASDAEHRTIRTQLETLMNRHFDAEETLRSFEIRDIERRLADARAESDRRRQRKPEMVRWTVDDIIHGAERPE